MHSSSYLTALVAAIAATAPLAAASPVAAEQQLPRRQLDGLAVGQGFLKDFIFEKNGGPKVDYAYKCGSPAEGKGKMDVSVCQMFAGHYLSPAGCTDTNTMGIYDDKGKPWECHAKGNAGATAYMSDPGVGTAGQVYSDACGWLAGRCGDNWNNAIIYPMSDTPTADKNTMGAIKIYAS